MQRTVQLNSISVCLSLNKANVKVRPLSSLIIKIFRVNLPYLAVCRRVGPRLQTTVTDALLSCRETGAFRHSIVTPNAKLKSVCTVSVSRLLCETAVVLGDTTKWTPCSAVQINTACNLLCKINVLHVSAMLGRHVQCEVQIVTAVQCGEQCNCVTACRHKLRNMFRHRHCLLFCSVPN